MLYLIGSLQRYLFQFARLDFFFPEQRLPSSLPLDVYDEEGWGKEIYSNLNERRKKSFSVVLDRNQRKNFSDTELRKSRLKRYIHLSPFSFVYPIICEIMSLPRKRHIPDARLLTLNSSARAFQTFWLDRLFVVVVVWKRANNLLWLLLLLCAFQWKTSRQSEAISLNTLKQRTSLSFRSAEKEKNDEKHRNN